MRKPTTILLAAALLVASASAAVAQPDSADQLAAQLPAETEQRIEALYDQYGLDSPWQHALRRVIDPDDFECGPTDFDVWIQGVLAETNLDTLAAIDMFAATAWPTFYSLLFDNEDADDFIGVNGEYTTEQRRRHRDNMRFWDVPTGDVQLHGMHGVDIADDAKMVPTVQFVLAVDAATAQAIVDLVQALIEGEPTIGYDHPFLTLNAFAFSAEGEEVPGVGAVPDKIVMGEGILEALDEMGLGDSGPDFVHAHEFAHHVQFEIGAFDSPLPPPEATRRTELMADGFAAYYATHARGATLRTKRVMDVVQSAFVVGDCAFDNPGHHGTPNQREAAAQWGLGLADDLPRGHVRSSLTMLDLFEAQLPILVAPDA